MHAWTPLSFHDEGDAVSATWSVSAEQFGSHLNLACRFARLSLVEEARTRGIALLGLPEVEAIAQLHEHSIDINAWCRKDLRTTESTET